MFCYNILVIKNIIKYFYFYNIFLKLYFERRDWKYFNDKLPLSVFASAGSDGNLSFGKSGVKLGETGVNSGKITDIDMLIPEAQEKETKGQKENQNQETKDEVVLTSIGEDCWHCWQGENLKFELDEDKKTATVVGVLEKESLAIPGMVVADGTKYTVTSIGDYAFIGCSSLKEINLPKGEMSIGERAFQHCPARINLGSRKMYKDDKYTQEYIADLKNGPTQTVYLKPVEK